MTTRKNATGHHELETITTLAAFLLLLNLLLPRAALVNSAFALLLLGLFVKPVARVISRLWLEFAEKLGAVNSRIILSLVFFLILTPMAFCYRLFSKDPLRIKRENLGKTLYVDRNHHYNRADFEKMW